MLKTGADFDGQTYSHTLDHKRLTGQLKRVYDVMSDGNWHRLPEIAHRAQGSEASCSARIRDLRKEKFGGFEVERRRHETQKGVFLYRLIVGQGDLF